MSRVGKPPSYAIRHPELVSGSHCEPSLTILRGQMLKQVQHDENDWHSRSEILKQVWYFAHLVVPLAVAESTSVRKSSNKFGISLT